MSLMRDDWVKLLVPLIFGGAILAPLGQFFLKEWYQPDVRYVVGGWYRSADLAVAGTRLRNRGHVDAENIFVTATFTNPLIDIATNDVTIPFASSIGGIGHKAVTGTITRLVPSEASVRGCCGLAAAIRQHGCQPNYITGCLGTNAIRAFG
jgi:hypothetical protein